jgi:hypothetical protein
MTRRIFEVWFLRFTASVYFLLAVVNVAIHNYWVTALMWCAGFLSIFALSHLKRY